MGNVHLQYIENLIRDSNEELRCVCVHVYSSADMCNLAHFIVCVCVVIDLFLFLLPTDSLHTETSELSALICSDSS